MEMTLLLSLIPIFISGLCVGFLYKDQRDRLKFYEERDEILQNLRTTWTTAVTSHNELITKVKHQDDRISSLEIGKLSTLKK